MLGARSDRRAPPSSARRRTCSASGSAPLPIAATAAGTPSARSLAITVRHGALCAAAHSTRTGRRLPSVPFRNGSGIGADDGGDVVGLAPVVQVPPDVVARVDVRRRRALRRLDPVDVVEPVRRVSPAFPARVPVDALDEAAAVLGRDLCRCAAAGS